MYSEIYTSYYHNVLVYSNNCLFVLWYYYCEYQLPARQSSSIIIDALPPTRPDWMEVGEALTDMQAVLITCS